MEQKHLDEEAVAEAYRRYRDEDSNAVHAGACRFGFLQGYRFALEQRSKLTERDVD